ncbi:MAG: hypothetical protein ACRDJM_09500 [Actinomycetota bacterium]
MKREDIVEFATRDRAALARLKARHWGTRRRERGAAEGLRAAEELRKHLAVLRPDWPSPEERAQDLADHIRTGEMLRRVAPLRHH